MTARAKQMRKVLQQTWYRDPLSLLDVDTKRKILEPDELVFRRSKLQVVPSEESTKEYALKTDGFARRLKCSFG